MPNKMQPAGIPTTADIAYNLELYANGKEINPNILHTAAEIVRKVESGQSIEVVQGQWIKYLHDVVDALTQIATYECNGCEYEGYDTTPYCPHCGGRMDGAANEKT